MSILNGFAGLPKRLFPRRNDRDVGARYRTDYGFLSVSAYSHPPDSICTNIEKKPTTQETSQEKIVALLRSNPSITRRALAGMVGLSEEGIKYHLNKLKSSGRVQRKGSTKAGHWETTE